MDRTSLIRHETPLVEKADDLASNMFPPRLLMIHDASRCGENDVAELTRWQQLDDPFLEIAELNVVSWRDDTCLVQAAVELNDDFAVAVIIDFLVFADVA